MSNDGYTNSALMGNWNEDRQLLKQKAKMFPDHREVCFFLKWISFLLKFIIFEAGVNSFRN